MSRPPLVTVAEHVVTGEPRWQVSLTQFSALSHASVVQAPTSCIWTRAGSYSAPSVQVEAPLMSVAVSV